MKKIFLLSLFLFFSISLIAFAQVTNLQVNGNSTNFSMASGDEVSWSFDVPNLGDTTFLEFWIDVNNNEIIDSEDVLWVYFNQIDGDPNGQNGPPDMDGIANGHVSFQQKVGLAPAHYVLSFKNNDSVVTIPGSVTPLDNITFTISGHVAVPSGYSSKNIVLELSSSSKNGTFWDALTDVNGDFSIGMDSDTTGNPWRLNISNGFNFELATVSPQRINLNIDSSVSKQYVNNNFTISAAAASISGLVKDGDGFPMVGTYVYINNNNGNFQSNANTDYEGKYYIGLSSNDLPLTNLNIGADGDSNTVQFNYNIPSINYGDSLTQDLYVLKANSVIRGRLTFNGNAAGMTNVFASCADTGYIWTNTNNDGYFVFRVSDKIYNYVIRAGQVPYQYISDSIVVHPGDTTASLNLILTSTNENEFNIPKVYSLSQNFPNPFNPTTMISYELSRSGMVSLKVFNVLGQEVKVLVNKFESAGQYNVQFNASELKSGVYFYQLQAGNYVNTRKMILLK